MHGLLATQIETSNSRFHLQLSGRGRNEKQVLEQGDFGKVRYALSQDGTEAAVKKYTLNDEDKQMMPYKGIIEAEREVHFYEKLGPGPHFPRALDVAHVEKDGGIKSYLFMGLLNGENGETTLQKMNAAIQNGEIQSPFARDFVKNIARQYVRAVADMHERGVVHNDIAPRNFMHSPEGHVTIIDFGKAQECKGFNNAFLLQSDYTQLGLIFKNACADVLKTFRDDADVGADIKSLDDIAMRLFMGTEPKEVLQHPYFQR